MADQTKVAEQTKTDGSKPAKLKVDKEKCTSCGSCVAAYDDVFEFDNDGKAQVKSDANFEGKDLEEIKSICAYDAIV